MQRGEIHELRRDCANASASESHRTKKMFDVLLKIIPLFNILQIILIDFDVSYPLQIPEFIKSVNFGSNLKKKMHKKTKKSHFPPKN